MKREGEGNILRDISKGMNMPSLEGGIFTCLPGVGINIVFIPNNQGFKSSSACLIRPSGK